jgi:hypothetical protein
MVVELQGPIWKYSRQWVGDDCEMFVTFDDNGRVMNRVLMPARRPRSWLPERVWRRLCERLGW